MRVEDIQQGVGEFRKLIVQPGLGAGGEERHAVQQAGDMRVIDRIRAEAQPAGDFWMGFGKFTGEPADGRQFLVEIPQ